jgi:hypothetical protein
MATTTVVSSGFLLIPIEFNSLFIRWYLYLFTIKVTNPNNKDWGIGQVQSIINDKVTVNFENAGKKVIHAKNVELKRIK